MADMRPMSQLPEEGQLIIITVNTIHDSVDLPYKYSQGIMYGFDGQYSPNALLFEGWRPLAEEPVEEGLKFSDLREANLERVPLFKNAKGELAFPDGIDTWDYSKWYTALSGEVGELGNFIKKINRGDFTLEEVREQVEDEFGDIQTYLDIFATRCGINLASATANKFNKVSDKQDLDIKLRQTPEVKEK